MSHALIIDDDADNLRVLQQMLKMAGIEATPVRDSNQVEGMLSGLKSVDIVILDLEMPDVDGYQLFQIISSHPNFKHVPIVACTVHTTEIDTARQLGFHSFISKPLNMDKFGDQLKSILQGNHVWNAY